MCVCVVLLQLQDPLCFFLHFRQKSWPAAGARIFSWPNSKPKYLLCLFMYVWNTFAFAKCMCAYLYECVEWGECIWDYNYLRIYLYVPTQLIKANLFHTIPFDGKRSPGRAKMDLFYPKKPRLSANISASAVHFEAHIIHFFFLFGWGGKGWLGEAPRAADDSESHIADLRLFLISGVLSASIPPSEARIKPYRDILQPPRWGSAERRGFCAAERWRCALLPPLYSQAPNGLNHPLTSSKPAFSSLKPAGEQVNLAPFLFFSCPEASCLLISQ